MEVLRITDWRVEAFTVTAQVGVRNGVERLVEVTHEVDQEAQGVQLTPTCIRCSGGELGGEQTDAGRGAIVLRATQRYIRLGILESQVDVMPSACFGVVSGLVGPGGSASQSIRDSIWGVGDI